MNRILEKIDKDISDSGGKRSKCRSLIIETFFRSGRHLTVDELTRKIRMRNRSIGSATVYRTLNLLSRLGYAKELEFGDGVRRYESSLVAHHDHLVCTGCGRVSEFEEPGIERLQDEVARRHGFVPAMHRLAIYGTCRECASPRAGENGG